MCTPTPPPHTIRDPVSHTYPGCIPTVFRTVDEILFLVRILNVSLVNLDMFEGFCILMVF